MTTPAGGDLFGADRPGIDADDWEDQDLLTKSEARVRIEQSIRVTEDELERVRMAQPERVPQLELHIKRARAVLEFMANQPGPSIETRSDANGR